MALEELVVSTPTPGLTTQPCLAHCRGEVNTLRFLILCRDRPVLERDPLLRSIDQLNNYIIYSEPLVDGDISTALTAPVKILSTEVKVFVISVFFCPSYEERPCDGKKDEPVTPPASQTSELVRPIKVWPPLPEATQQLPDQPPPDPDAQEAHSLGQVASELRPFPRKGSARCSWKEGALLGKSRHKIPTCAH
ncbi:unnamed protein product [Nezara viridula]|uniref:Uncharacterized protein n=1 Tax=Nezara viridula TaxID=85310 RepID=A0A9P0EER5_NEZVI|nr:unnamed protein product [Nezara viridula]